jgi:hypothetical protein
LSEDLSLIVIRIRYKVKYTFHHPTSNWLPRMYSRCYHDSFFFNRIICTFTCNC